LEQYGLTFKILFKMKKLEISQLVQMQGGDGCVGAMAGCAAGAGGLFGFGPAVMAAFFIVCSTVGCSQSN
jgi:hypothetical protein